MDALDGMPGVYSARYAGEQANAENNINKLLNAMQHSNDRAAQFRTVIALRYKGASYTFEGSCKGEILQKRSGAEGFGYDPIFKPLGEKLSFAAMSMRKKNSLSHRGKAMEHLVNFFKTKA